MSILSQILITSAVIIVILQINTFVVYFLHSKGYKLKIFPLNFMLKIHEWFGDLDKLLGRTFRGYAYFVDNYGWETADRTFKILGWILIAGTIRAIAHISDHPLLRGLAYIIFFILGLGLSVLTSKASLAVRNRILSQDTKQSILILIFSFIVSFALIILVWLAISLIVYDITNFLPPNPNGIDSPANHSR